MTLPPQSDAFTWAYIDCALWSSLGDDEVPLDVAVVAQGRADAALVGEALMRQDDPRGLLEAMVEAAS